MLLFLLLEQHDTQASCTDLGLDLDCIMQLIGPRTIYLITSEYDEMIVIELAVNFLVSGGFLYPRTPAEPINRVPGGWVTLCGAVSRGKSNKTSPCRGWAIRIKFSSASCPIFFLVVNTLKDF